VSPRPGRRRRGRRRIPRHFLRFDLHPRHRRTWHYATGQAARARDLRRTVLLAALLLGLLAVVGRLAPTAGLDRGAALLLTAGLAALLRGRRRRAVRRGLLFTMGLLCLLAGAAREALVRTAARECRAIIARTAPGPERAIALEREPVTGLRARWIQEWAPRQCEELIPDR
jgi:hypothetical protein